MQQVVAHQPAIARAVRRLSLCDQLALTLELLLQVDWPECSEHEPFPPYHPLPATLDQHGALATPSLPDLSRD
jgi:hypothetical protein